MFIKFSKMFQRFFKMQLEIWTETVFWMCAIFCKSHLDYSGLMLSLIINYGGYFGMLHGFSKIVGLVCFKTPDFSIIRSGFTRDASKILAFVVKRNIRETEE